jgi:hypothetical protein
MSGVVPLAREHRNSFDVMHEETTEADTRRNSPKKGTDHSVIVYFTQGIW